MIPGIRKTMVKIQPTNLFTTVLIICYCNAGVLPPKIDQSSVSPPIPTPLRSGKCEYNGKYYEPGLITINKDGDCVSDVTCMEGGVISIGDSSGCFGSMDKGTDDHYRLQASCAVWAMFLVETLLLSLTASLRFCIFYYIACLHEVYKTLHAKLMLCFLRQSLNDILRRENSIA